MTTENKDIGYIKIYRSIKDWDWWADLNTFRLFVVLLINANWRDKKWRGRKIKRGQLWTSLDTLVEESGLTKMQVRTSLDKLISTHEITRKATHSGQLITIVNYDFYQSSDGDITHEVTHKVTDEQHTDNTPITLTKEVKEVKEVVNVSVENSGDNFDLWSRLSDEDVDRICQSYPETGLSLISTVAKEVAEHKRKVKSPVQYILSYATRKQWNDELTLPWEA